LQLERNHLDRAAQRNESIRRGLETEVESLNDRIDSLNKELARSRSWQTSQQDPLETINELQTNNDKLESQVTAARKDAAAAILSEKEAKKEANRIEKELCEARERLALFQAAKNHHENAASSAENMLKSLQDIWSDLGVSSDQREKVRILRRNFH